MRIYLNRLARDQPSLGISSLRVLREMPSKLSRTLILCAECKVSKVAHLILRARTCVVLPNAVMYANAEHRHGVCTTTTGSQTSKGLFGVTYLLIVSESPIIQRWRFGRVIATVKHKVSSTYRTIPCSQASGRQDLPFNRLFSPKKPTSCSGLLRTRLTMTASFSRPWKPSTLPSSMPA